VRGSVAHTLRSFFSFALIFGFPGFFFDVVAVFAVWSEVFVRAVAAYADSASVTSVMAVRSATAWASAARAAAASSLRASMA